MKAIGLLLTLFIALRASPNYSVNDLGTLGSSSAIGFKINNSGTAIGWAETVYGYSRAFQSAPGGTLQTLAALSASDSYAQGINSAGVIAGTAYVNGQPHGVIWNGSSTADLGAGIFVTGINDPGAVIGGNGHAFILVNGVYRDLGVLPVVVGVRRPASTKRAPWSATVAWPQEISAALSGIRNPAWWSLAP